MDGIKPKERDVLMDSTPKQKREALEVFEGMMMRCVTHCYNTRKVGDVTRRLSQVDRDKLRHLDADLIKGWFAEECQRDPDKAQSYRKTAVRLILGEG